MTAENQVRGEIEVEIEKALDLGQFIRYRESYDFIRELEKVASRIAELVRGGQAGVAIGLYETFIGGCYEKADEVHGSDGMLGDFVCDLFCSWIEARQAVEADRGETARLLLWWMENDDYGFASSLEKGAVKALDTEGLAAFTAEVRLRLAASRPDEMSSYRRRRWIGVLKHILAVRDDTAGYYQLCEETELTAADCDVLAAIHQRRQELEVALEWVERGLALAPGERAGPIAEHHLEKRHRELLVRLGRGEEALELAWAEFAARPNQFDYETLMGLVPEGERAAWHGKAMAAAENGQRSSVIELFVATGEVDRLARHVARLTDVQLEEISHFFNEPAAGLLAEPYPDLAARVYRALGLRVVNAKKSKYYQAALGSLAKARDCYLRAGQEQTWRELVEEIRRRHHRKSSFIPGFERVAAGGAAQEPGSSFLERTRGRWPRIE